MARATKEESLKTRQRIIDTAIELFYQHGVSVITLEKIAESAALTRGAIYWHFKNKQDVISAIHEQFHISILGMMNKELENTAHPPLTRIHAASINFLESLEGESLNFRIMSIFHTKLDYSGDMAQFIQRQEECKDCARELMTACFAEAIKDGTVHKDYDADWLNRMFMCFLSGIITEYITNNKMFKLKKEAPTIVSFFLNKLDQKPL